MQLSNVKNLSSIIVLLYGSLSIDARVLREVKTLSDNGYHVTVLDTDLGFGKWTEYKRVHNFQILKMEIKQRTNILMMLRFWYRCLKYLIKNQENIRVVHAHDLTALPPASIFSFLFHNKKVIYDSHELFPEAAGEKLSIFLYALFLGLELIFSRFIDKLIAASPGIARILSKRIKSSISVVRNLPHLNRIRSNLGQIPKWNGIRGDGKIRVAYSGIVLKNRGYEKVLETSEILTNQFQVECEFWIIGDGPYLDEFKELVIKQNLDSRFVFKGCVSFEKLLSLTTECDLAVALYESTKNNNSSISNKIFEYMMIGMPFIFTNLTQSIPFLKRVDACIVDNPVTGYNLANVIYTLYSNLARMQKISERGITSITSRLNWEIESERLLHIYEELWNLQQD